MNLGDVKNLAEVSVNGNAAGIAWHAPYRLDVPGALEPDADEISVKRASAWVNRLIGARQPNAESMTFTVMEFSLVVI